MKYRATFILWSFWYASEQFDDHSVNACTIGINFKVDKEMQKRQLGLWESISKDVSKV